MTMTRKERAERFSDPRTRDGVKTPKSFEGPHRVAHDGGKFLTNKEEALMAFFRKKGKDLDNLSPHEQAALEAARRTGANGKIVSSEALDQREAEKEPSVRKSTAQPIRKSTQPIVRATQLKCCELKPQPSKGALEPPSMRSKGCLLYTSPSPRDS
eukprot:TRINITY_DN36950_c0_g1_i1.p1 TRINITY_DN36950_c0_g1~~TRINITY_DN36950_c0_g1_i1.p1  ORF type:complete len:156 (-),score=34.92 TRINITY_DN36950_c0_g1_i1:150-617(-)